MASAYYVSCKDLGVNCDFETHGGDLHEVIELCADHGRKEHGLRGFGPELYTKIRSAVHAVEKAAATDNPGQL